MWKSVKWVIVLLLAMGFIALAWYVDTYFSSAPAYRANLELPKQNPESVVSRAANQVKLATIDSKPVVIGTPAPGIPNPLNSTSISPKTPTLSGSSNLTKSVSPLASMPAISLDDEPSTQPDDSVKIVSDFECASPLKVEHVGLNHFAVTIVTKSTAKNWFMFQLQGVKGRTVRIDIKNAPLGKWKTLNPVYSYVKSLDDLDSFATTEPTAPHAPTVARNGPLLPDTSGQKWHYIAQVASEKGSLCFTQKYEEDNAYIAMRVPYTPKYNENYLASIADRPGVKVIEVGKSKEGRPLLIVQIGNGDPALVPCVVMYAREHADEHDGSWIARGAIDSLLRDVQNSKVLLSHCNFIVIPMLDPDGAVHSEYEHLTHQFVYDGRSGVEALAYAKFFREWVEANKRLDLVFNIHNVESSEWPHILSVVKERGPIRGQAGLDLDEKFLRPLFNQTIYKFQPRSERDGENARFRLGGYLAFFYGPLHMPYEVNCQDKSRHLSIEETIAIGGILLHAGVQFLESSDAQSLLAVILMTRESRNERVNRCRSIFGSDENSLRIEWISFEKSKVK